MSGFKPAHMFAEISNNNRTMSKNQELCTMKQLEDEITKVKTNFKREIQVSCSAEFRVITDRAKVSLYLYSSKNSASESKNSVNRRLEYVLQTLKNHQVKVSFQRNSPKEDFILFNINCLATLKITIYNNYFTYLFVGNRHNH